MQKAIFLDRDGVINKDKNHLYKTSDFELTEGIVDLLKKYMKQQYLIIVITNQSGIAKGLYTEKDFSEFTYWMCNYMEALGVHITKVYHCPHHPNVTGPCFCRKPNTGMIMQAKEEFNIDLSQSILIGDQSTDIEAGINAGIGRNYYIDKLLEVNQ